ncbi:MAG TPA: hypothetical protein PK765_01865 [bacterium]|nr:hypothetical protein [bacterium]
MTDSVTAPEYIGSDIEMRANPETITSEAVMGSSSDMSESSTRTGSVLESPSAVISTSVATYDNPVVGYGFDMPKSSYYQGFGARDGAVHSVAVQAGTGVTTFEDATVRVLLYRSILEPLMENGRKIISDEESGRVYVRIGTGMTAVVEASSMDDPTARVIVESLREARTTPATDDIVAPIGQ